MPDLSAQLSPHQRMLIQTMAQAFLQSGQWPVWHYIATELDRKGVEAERLLKS